MNEPIDLHAVSREFLVECGPCDYGILGPCNCPERDYRSTMHTLVVELSNARHAIAKVRSHAETLRFFESVTGGCTGEAIIHLIEGGE